jgi:germination protein M
MRARLLALAALPLALAACGSTRTAATAPATTSATTTAAAAAAPTTTATAPATTALRVYHVREGKLAADRVEVPQTTAVAAAALHALGISYRGLTIANGVASLTLEGDKSHATLAQVVYTLTQFPSVDAVEADGHRYTRADFEDLAPAILVESPTPGDRVTSPVRVRGTANTFEATFQLQLLDGAGNVIVERTVTATSGSGTRGTFDVSIPADVHGAATLVAFETSAEDGSRVHQVEVPIELL